MYNFISDFGKNSTYTILLLPYDDKKLFLINIRSDNISQNQLKKYNNKKLYEK